MVAGHTQTDGTIGMIGFLGRRDGVEVEINNVVQRPYRVAFNRLQFVLIIDVDIAEAQLGKVAHDIVSRLADRDDHIVAVPVLNGL